MTLLNVCMYLGDGHSIHPDLIAMHYIHVKTFSCSPYIYTHTRIIELRAEETVWVG